MLAEKRGSGWSLAAIVALTGLALALRIYRLQFQSLWWDEGISIYLSGLDLAHLTTAKDFAIDLHPPLYHILLGLWRGVAGSSVFALRSFSAALGTLAVPVTFVVGRRAAGSVAGLIAAGLLATSPFAIFSGQEVRMYTLLPLLGIISVAICQRLLDELGLETLRRPGLWAALVFVNVLGLYSYYYFGLLILAEDLALMLALVSARSGRSTWLAWVASQALAAALFLPWAITLAGLFQSGIANAIPVDAEVHRTLTAFLRETVVAFVVGFSSPARLTVAAVVAAGGFAAVGFAASRRRYSGWLLALGIAVPLAGAYGILLYRPFYYPRFINYSSPLLDILFAAGIVALFSLARRTGRVVQAVAVTIGACGFAVVVVAAGASLAVQYREPRVAYSTADYRVTLADLAELAEPGDLIVGTYPWQLGYVAGYQPNAGLEAIHAPTDFATSAGVSRLVADHQRVWLLLYSAGGRWQPDRFETALGSFAHPAFDSRFGDSRIRLFTTSSPAPSANPAARFDDSIALLAYQVGRNAAASQQYRPGETVNLTLTWQTLAPVAQSYTEFIHLIGPDGRVVAQEDSPPLAGARPTNTWAADETLVDRHELLLPTDAPVGDYFVEIGLYRPATGERLSTNRSSEEKDRVIIGRFQVAR